MSVCISPTIRNLSALFHVATYDKDNRPGKLALTINAKVIWTEHARELKVSFLCFVLCFSSLPLPASVWLAFAAHKPVDLAIIYNKRPNQLVLFLMLFYQPSRRVGSSDSFNKQISLLLNFKLSCAFDFSVCVCFEFV